MLIVHDPSEFHDLIILFVLSLSQDLWTLTPNNRSRHPLRAGVCFFLFSWVRSSLLSQAQVLRFSACSSAALPKYCWGCNISFCQCSCQMCLKHQLTLCLKPCIPSAPMGVYLFVLSFLCLFVSCDPICVLENLSPRSPT